MRNSRVLTALVAAPIFIGLTYVGGWPYFLLVLALGLIAQWELYEMAKAGGLNPLKWSGLGLGVVAGLHPVWPYWGLALLVAVPFIICAFPFLRGDRPLERMAVTIVGAVYPTGLLVLLARMRLLDDPLLQGLDAFWLTMMVLLLIWSADTGAYYAGRAFGKRPLFPAVSPKKTWEGYIGGLITAVGIALVLKFTVLGVLEVWHALLIGFFCGAVAPLGDLAESRIKRSVGVKDSGSILPGHGGVLDRFDAMLVALPAVYVFVQFVVLA
ncbi:MAG: phosphatidate cytidylyltransferase [Bacteroidota bacterium]